MDASLTQQRRVDDEALWSVKSCQWGRNIREVTVSCLTVPAEEVPANSVPAAAVIRGGQALFGFTGRKGRVGAFKSDVKTSGSTTSLHSILLVLSIGEESGIPGVAVECVDIWKNTSSEGGFLA